VYRLTVRHSLDELLLSYLEDNPVAGNGFPPEDGLLVVQNRHVQEWLRHQSALRRGVSFHVPVAFPDDALRTIVVALSIRGFLGDRPTAPTLLYPDSVALRLYQCLGEETKGQERAYLEGIGDDPADRYAFAAAMAKLFHAYAQNHAAALPQLLAPGRGGWQFDLWRRAFGSESAPGPYLIAGLKDALSIPSGVRGLQLSSGRTVHKITIFGSAFLPERTIRFLHELASSGGSQNQPGIVDVNHYLFLPFRTDWPQALPHGPASRWAFLGNSTLGYFQDLGVKTGADAVFNGVAEPSWANAENKALPTLRLLSCEGLRRQVEECKEAILELLDSDENLDVNKVVVLCPDPERFRTMVETVFPSRELSDAASGEAPDHVPFHFLDVPAEPGSPFLQALRIILENYGAPLTRSVVSSLLRNQAFLDGFGMDEQDASSLLAWIVDTGIRGPLDGVDRLNEFATQRDEATWARGLSRLLLGWVLPDGVEAGGLPALGLQATDAGSFDHLLTMLRFLAKVSRKELWSQDEVDVGTWATRVRKLFLGVGEGEHDDAPVASTTPGDATTDDKPMNEPGRDAPCLKASDTDQGPGVFSKIVSATVQRGIDLEHAGLGDAKDIKLAFGAYKAMLLEAIDSQRVTKGQALLQGVCFAAFTAFRSIPFDHVFMLGMNEGDFPAPAESRSLYPAVFLSEPVPLDPRNQDLYAFLETLSSARKTLTILYQGRDPVSGEELLPAAPVCDLLETWPERFTAGKAQESGLHSWSESGLASVIRSRRTRRILAAIAGEKTGNTSLTRDDHLEISAAADTENLLPLEARDLVFVFRNPLSAWMRTRFGMVLKEEDDESVDDDLRFAPDFWSLKARTQEALSVSILAVLKNQPCSPEEMSTLVRQGLAADARAGSHVQGLLEAGTALDLIGYFTHLDTLVASGTAKATRLDVRFGLQSVPSSDPLRLQFSLSGNTAGNTTPEKVFGQANLPWWVEEQGENTLVRCVELGATKAPAFGSAGYAALADLCLIVPRLPVDTPETTGFRLDLAGLGGKVLTARLTLEAARELVDELLAAAEKARQSPVPWYRGLLPSAMKKEEKGFLELLLRSNELDAVDLRTCFERYFEIHGDASSDPGARDRGHANACPYFRLVWGGMVPAQSNPAHAPGLPDFARVMAKVEQAFVDEAKDGGDE